MYKHLRGFPKKIPAYHCFLKAWRKDLGKQVQVTGELPRNSTSISEAFPMLLNNIPAVSECLVEARHLLVPWQSPVGHTSLSFSPRACSAVLWLL